MVGELLTTKARSTSQGGGECHEHGYSGHRRRAMYTLTTPKQEADPSEWPIVRASGATAPTWLPFFTSKLSLRL